MASHLHIKLLILMPLAFLGIWLIIAHSPLRQQKLQGRQQMDSGIKQEISTLDEDQGKHRLQNYLLTADNFWT